MPNYTDAKKQAFNVLRADLSNAAKGTLRCFKKERVRLVGTDGAAEEIKALLKYLGQQPPATRHLGDLDVLLWNYFRGRTSDDTTTVANCAPERLEPVSAERQSRGQLRSPCRDRSRSRDDSRSRGDSFSPRRNRRNRRNRSSSPVRPEPSYHTASSQPAFEELASSVSFLMQAEKERQQKAAKDAEPYRVTKAVRRAGSVMRDSAAAFLTGTRDGAAAFLTGTRDGVTAVAEGTRRCGRSATQAIARQAANAVVNGSQIADTAANVGGSACSAYVGVKLADKMMSSDTKNTAGIIAGAGVVIHACRLLAARHQTPEQNSIFEEH